MLVSRVLNYTLIVVGGIGLFKALYALVALFYRYLIYNTDWSRWQDKKSNEDYALVTGCTDGIGKEYAFQLAAKGYNLILISRTQHKLETVKDEILEKYESVEVEIYACDYSTVTDADYKEIEELVEGKRIRALINNVGKSYLFPEYTHLVKASDLDDIIKINVNSMVKMTNIVVPQMIQNYTDNKQRSLICNIGSFSHFGAPLLGVYSGTKAFVGSYSTSLRTELIRKGVDVTWMHPLFVATKLSKMRPALTTPTCTRYVKSALRVMGDKDVKGLGGFFWHDVAYLLLAVIPKRFLLPAILKMHLGLRKRAYKKYKLE